MLALGKSGEAAYTRDRDISVRRPLPTDKCHMGARSLHFLWLLEKNNKVRHNNIVMTQMASLLAVAPVFVGLWTLDIYILQSEKGGAYVPDKTSTTAKL